MPRAFVHLGTQKTGTTTFQTWAATNREEIKRATGLRYYSSVFLPGLHNRPHIEFALLSIRPDRSLPARDVMAAREARGIASVVTRSNLLERTIAHLEQELDGEDLLISCEGLSLIRHPDEVERLRELLAGYDLEFVVTRRDPAAFLRSYRQWMVNSSFDASSDPLSCFYIEPDTWLLDLDALDPLFPGLRWVDYEDAMSTYGSVTPALFVAMGFPIDDLPDWKVPELNRAEGSTLRTSRLRRLVRRVLR